MRKCLLVFVLGLLFSFSAIAQSTLIVNEISQGTNNTKEYVEFVVIGTRTCTDSTADLRNWIFDDHNGWYGGSGTGIAAGHYRFKNISEWSKIPYGSIILIYNNADRNLKIPVGSDDPTDVNHDYVYVLPITSDLLEQNINEPISPSTFNYTYPVAGYNNPVDWTSIGLANGGDAVIIVNPTNLSVANHSVLFGFTPATGAQVPNVAKGAVGAGACLYLSDGNYNTEASWLIGVAGTADETPGAGNSPDNLAWINAMRTQTSSFNVTASVVNPSCPGTMGAITVTSPTGTNYTYALNGGTFQTANVFSNLTPGTYLISVKEDGGCESTLQVYVANAQGVPDIIFTVLQPSCAQPFGGITITSPPVSLGYTFSINGVDFQADPVFNNLAPGTYTITIANTLGCTRSTSTTINTPTDQPALPAVTSPVNYCLNQTATPLAASGNNLLWYNSLSGGTGQSTPPTPLTSSAGTTSYYVSQTINGCESNRAEIIVQVTDFDLDEIEGIDTICLSGNTFAILSNSFVGGTWSSSNPAVATISTGGMVTAVAAGTTTITYAATSGGCPASVSMDVTVNDFSLSLDGPLAPVNAGTSVILNASAIEPFIVTSWLPINLFTDQSLTSQTIIASSSELIKVIGVSTYGCIDTAQFELVVIPQDEELYIPNAFSPNHDGINDVFRPYGNSIIMVETTIFNQWGEKIFSGKGLPGGWDGLHKGKLQPSGVYVYVLKITLQSGRVETKKGAVNLIH
ncbi:MAG: gliding motility-associated C-terminal domain-containing protein [Ferruginibacter sp.]|nr:gliding motility-associated C-terminal domain-containing protein [Ferruginibacter sp.]